MKDGITLGIALLGVGLGVLNFWRTVSRDRVRLRIQPQNYCTGAGEEGACFEVVNLGFTAVVVNQVGVSLSGGKVYYLPTSRLPERLEPRATLTILWPPGAEQHPAMAGGKRAFVKTACGCQFHGRSPALKGWVEQAQKATGLAEVAEEAVKPAVEQTEADAVAKEAP